MIYIDFLELAKKRKTTYEFSEKAVKNRDIRKILQAGIWAPSCSNTQPWNFIVVKNKKTVSELVELCSYGSFHTEPSAVIALILDPTCKEEHHVCVHGSLVAIYEAHLCIGMAGLNMVYEALSLGIDSCFISPEPKRAAKILKVPPDRKVVLLVGLGYEKRGTFQKKRGRKSIREIVSHEYFSRKVGI